MFRWFSKDKKSREMSSYGRNALSGTDNETNSSINKNGEPSYRGGFQNVYEEFDPKIEETQTCPTCGGSGKLTKEQEHDLVALIPVRDRRLKPRRTMLYLALAVFLCLAICTVIAVIFFPRSITLKIGSAKPGNISMPTQNTSSPFIIINSTISFHNSNFFEAHLDNFTIEVNWDGYVVANVDAQKTIKVQPHSSANHTFYVKTEYKKQEATKIRRICCGWSYNLAFMITVSAKTHSLTVSSETSDSTVKYINCELKGSEWWKSCM